MIYINKNTFSVLFCFYFQEGSKPPKKNIDVNITNLACLSLFKFFMVCSIFSLTNFNLSVLDNFLSNKIYYVS